MRISYFQKTIRNLFFFLLSLFFLVTIVLLPPTEAFSSSLVVDGINADSIIEHLRLKVTSKDQAAWLKAERGSWGPWLSKQKGFLGRQLLWDKERQEAIVLITWANRDLWKDIPQEELDLVQEKFEKIARSETGQQSGNPFPLEFAGELLPK